MTTLEHPRVPTSDTTTCELEHLERVAQALWGVEPNCAIDERFTLMTRLSSVCAELDRARVRRNAHPHDAVDLDMLHRTWRELDALTAAWTSPSNTSGQQT